MAADPVQECIRTSLELLEEADREGIKAKRQLTQILGPDEPEDARIWLVAYCFEAGKTSHRGLMTPTQRDYLKKYVDDGATPEVIRDILVELLRKIFKLARDTRDILIQGLMGEQDRQRAGFRILQGTTDPGSCTWDPNQCATGYTLSACLRQPNGAFHLSNTCPPIMPPGGPEPPPERNAR
jgi:hypothetical protein